LRLDLSGRQLVYVTVEAPGRSGDSTGNIAAELPAALTGLF
jgi:hypothetical protein